MPTYLQIVHSVQIIISHSFHQATHASAAVRQISYNSALFAVDIPSLIKPVCSVLLSATQMIVPLVRKISISKVAQIHAGTVQ